MQIKKVRLVNSNMSVAIDYLDESGQEHLLIVGAEKIVKNWQSVEHTLSVQQEADEDKVRIYQNGNSWIYEYDGEIISVERSLQMAVACGDARVEEMKSGKIFKL